jgi:hypothetical protein
MAPADGRRHAKGARDAERFASLKRAAWDGAHDEVQVDRIHHHRVRERTGNGIAECC